MRGAAPALALLAALLLAAPASAVTRYLAFGDSITLGVGDDPGRAEQGYPPRLEARLQAAGVDAEVENHGKGAERTPEGLTRLDEVLAGGGDVLLLMEGSNDISRFISLETTHFNLAEMARKAERRGLQAVHATLIPRVPWATVDPENTTNQRLCQRIRHTAGNQGRLLADPFEVFGSLADPFSSLYINDPVDRVGHPNAVGYDELAGIFFDVLTGVDSVPPVPGLIAPDNGRRNIAARTRVDVDVWDFGTGIDVAATTMTINGQAVDATVSGGPDKVELRYQPPEPLVGVVQVGLRSRDLATPANERDDEIARFIIAGTVFFDGDLDESGRVDGADLVRFSLLFGSSVGDGRYDADADFNGDGAIDGDDLAVLAANFGRSSF